MRSTMFMKALTCQKIGRVLAILVFAGSYSLSTYASGAYPEPLVTAEYIRNLVTSKSLGTVDSVLAALPTHYRSSFVLLHDSQSIQQASYQNPRVLLVGKDNIYDNAHPSNEAVISFNGHPSQFGFDRIEMLQWLPNQRRFELSEITFSNGQSKISNPNPSRCLSCHARGGTEPYPIWNPYFRWPNAYGSEDGHIKIGSAEDGAFRKFLKNRTKNSRYSSLIPKRELDFKTSKFADFLSRGEKLDPMMFDQQGAGYWIEPYQGDGLDNLSQRLDRQNVQRIERQIEESPRFNKFKKIISCSAGAWGEQHFSNIVIAKRFVADFQKAFSDYSSRTEEEVKAKSEFTQSQLRTEPYEQGEMTALAFFSQTLLGADPSKWSIAPATKALVQKRPAGGGTERDLFLYADEKWQEFILS